MPENTFNSLIVYVFILIPDDFKHLSPICFLVGSLDSSFWELGPSPHAWPLTQIKWNSYFSLVPSVPITHIVSQLDWRSDSLCLIKKLPVLRYYTTLWKNYFSTLHCVLQYYFAVRVFFKHFYLNQYNTIIMTRRAFPHFHCMLSLSKNITQANCTLPRNNSPYRHPPKVLHTAYPYKHYQFYKP